jgi:hypothetical protein
VTAVVRWTMPQGVPQVPRRAAGHPAARRVHIQGPPTAVRGADPIRCRDLNPTNPSRHVQTRPPLCV